MEGKREEKIYETYGRQHEREVSGGAVDAVEEVMFLWG